jgi:hypothetical protein
MPRQYDGKDCLFAARIAAANLNRAARDTAATLQPLE